VNVVAVVGVVVVVLVVGVVVVVLVVVVLCVVVLCVVVFFVVVFFVTPDVSRSLARALSPTDSIRLTTGGVTTANRPH
jgi:hypothetical protein